VTLRETIIVIVIFIIALVVRLCYLLIYPVFRFDELGENLWAYTIIKEGHIPLTNTVPFIGALYNYLAAFMYFILRSILSFRLLVAILGAMTVLLLYEVAKELTNSRSIALYSALILTFMPPHILIASHVAWSASLTPFFLLLSLYVFLHALKRNSRIRWLFFGISLGLTLQVHPSVIASFVGLFTALTYVFGRNVVKKMFSLRTFTFILMGFSLGYINMIIYNVIKPLDSLTFALSAKWTGLSSNLTFFEYLRRLAFITLEFISMFPTGIPIVSIPHLVKSPLFYLFVSSFLVILAYAVIRTKLGKGIFMYIVISILILAIGTKGIMALNIFGFAWGPHYLQQLVPLTALLMGLGMGICFSQSRGLHRYKALLRKLIMFIVFSFIVLWPFSAMMGTINYLDQKKCTNRLFLKVVNELKTKLNTNTPIYVKLTGTYPTQILLYELLILENMIVYPRFNTFLKQYLKNPYKLIGYVTSEFKVFLNVVNRQGRGAIILDPTTKTPDVFLRKIIDNYNVVVDHVVYGCFGKPFYRILIFEKHDTRKVFGTNENLLQPED